MTRKVILTRLPVGHTHEDIDGVFGNIWTFIDGKHSLYTPQAYKRVLMLALMQIHYAVHVRDIICVPDYQAWIRPYMGEVERYAVGNWTQLQWMFEAVDHCSESCKCSKCSKYPTRVKVNCRRCV